MLQNRKEIDEQKEENAKNWRSYVTLYEAMMSVA